MNRPSSTFRVLAWLVLSAALLVPAPAGAQADLGALLQRLPDEPPLPGVSAAKAALASRSAKIDPSLLLLGDEVRSKGISEIRSKALELNVVVEQQRVLVMLHAEDDGGTSELEDAVEDLGGEVQATFENTVFARVPALAIEKLAGIEELYFAAPQPRFEARQARGRSIRSDGVAVSKVDHLHKSGVRGKGVRVGILDFGYQGLGDLVARGELPKPKAVQAFGAPSHENGVVHGTACAEIIHDMAPEAELYLASVGQGGSASNGDIVAAAQWLAEQKVQIISFSGGGHGGPHNGSSLLDRLVDSLVQEHGILWVNAAGNEADAHWGGVVRDSDNDKVIEIDQSGNWAIAFQPLRGDVALLINWDDWGSNPSTPSSSQDIDAFLFEVQPNRELVLVAKSDQPQGGRGQPLEFIQYRATNPRQVLVLALRATKLDKPVALHVYAMTPVRMEPKTPVGSIGVPATARNAIAVGAVNVRKATLEAFSGQGPTDDGRLKPDVAAADDNITLAYRGSNNPDGRFPGTSAACPHVSGFAALLKQIHGGADTARLRALVVQHVRDMGTKGPDNEFGSGHIDGSGLNGHAATDEDEGNEEGGNAEIDGVPDAFGDSPLTTRKLEALWRKAREAGARDDVKVVTGQPSYRIGDGMRVGLRSDRAGYYMLVHRSAAGEFTVLAPDGDESRLEGGRQYALPRGEAWIAREPIGREGLLLVCSSRRIDLARWIEDPDEDLVWMATAIYEVRR